MSIDAPICKINVIVTSLLQMFCVQDKFEISHNTQGGNTGIFVDQIYQMMSGDPNEGQSQKQNRFG